MGIGLPDWYNIKKAGAVSALGDMGELAARLGSIVTFDRRGDVVFLESFEEGIAKWTTGGNGTGYSVAMSVGAARSGGFSMKMTAGSDGSREALARLYKPRPVGGTLGLEAHVVFGSETEYFYWWLDLYDGTDRHQARLRFDPANSRYQYLALGGAWADLVTGVSLSAVSEMFHAFKLVADFENDEWVRVIVNEVETDMSGVALRVSADSTYPHLRVELYHSGRSGYNPAVYVDDVIITQNEP